MTTQFVTLGHSHRKNAKINGGHRQSFKDLVYSLLWPAECPSLHRLTWYFEASQKHTGLGNMARSVVAHILLLKLLSIQRTAFPMCLFLPVGIRVWSVLRK